MASRPPDFEPPAEFDDYLIVKKLGQGATGHVYLAEDAVLARQIAIKFIGVDPDPAARQQFLLEARAAARIQHPNVVSIYRVGELGDRPYIVSELVRGTPLSEAARPIAWTSALALAVEIARGLAAAHRRGVVHCDIKPANVIITEEGVAKLVDFGLARVVREGSADAAGAFAGTPDYMAPEVWAGQPSTWRSDVYSVGALIYELVAGAPPFASAASSDLARLVRETDAPELDTDSRLAAIVRRCLSRDPAARFATGEELREVLERLQAVRSSVIQTDVNPYRGLRPFEAAHRGVFFGRGLEVSTLVDRLRTESVVVIAGDSGVGKSSLCRAGVVPAILDGALGDHRAWRALTIVPGRRPLAALAVALEDPELAARLLEEPELLSRELHRRAGRGGIVLFVDQLEEMITVGEPREVAAFDAALARISAGATGVRLLTTVRSDFLSRVVALPQLGQELARVLHFVRPLPPERIRDVITGPASTTNVAFESEAMIQALVEATAHAGSGGLPLLSFALAELWEARDRDRGLITQATLDTMGGVAGALARHADAVIAGMAPGDRVHARRALLRLVTSSGTRIRRTEAELAVSENTQAAVAAMVSGRLLVVHDGETGPTYELAHEVLVRGWGTLRDWLDADVDERARRERLGEACAEWDRLGRRADATWRGTQLEEALAIDATNLTAIERDFIAASVRAVRRRRWMRRGILAGALSLAVGVYSAQRIAANHRLAEQVDAELEAARADLGDARRENVEQAALARRAFAMFDRGDAAEAERSWEQVLARRAASARLYRAAGRGVEAALAKDPEREDVRDLLGDVLLERALLAELVRDGAIRDELIGRIDSYDRDGSRRARLDQPGHVTIEARGATILLDGRSIGVDRAELDVAPGAHVLEAQHPGASVRTVILVERDASTDIRLAQPAGVVPAGFIYVPAGTFLYGSAADEETRKTFLTAVPLHARATGAFLIARAEVTFGEWLAYVEASPEAQRPGLLPHLPFANGTSGVVLDRVDDRWRLSVQPVARAFSARSGEPIRYEGRDRRVVEDWLRFPVLGISAADAEAYAAWLDRTGAVAGARLCTEVEWERAARGADGRESPTGRSLEADDANIDSTYGRDLMGPDEVGAHPTSVSPYGVWDTAGNAFEWTRQDRGGYVQRGGSYWHDRKTASLANRNEAAAELRDATLGMRVCATPRP